MWWINKRGCKRKDHTFWHKWFVWFPCVVGETPDGDKIWAWLETVNRRAIDYIYHHELDSTEIVWAYAPLDGAEWLKHSK